MKQVGCSVAPWLASVASCSCCLALLIWPALLNGYPLVFADTGTYLSQAIKHYIGWDRPAVYSVFLLLTHWKITTWSSVLIQAGLVVYVLDAVRRGFVPKLPRGFLLPIVGLLCVATPLPWFASQLMPDVFTSMLVVVLALLLVRPDTIGTVENRMLILFAAWMIGAHLSNVWITLLLLVALIPTRRLLGATSPFDWRAAGSVLAPAALAMLVLCTVNLYAFKRFTLSPFGNVFLLARLVYDGPAEMTLEKDCANTKWRLCSYLPVLPPHAATFPSSDHFLWRLDGPVARLGGAKLVSAEAKQIIFRTVQEHPGLVLKTAFGNLQRQLLRFRSGDGLNAWPRQVGPILHQSFPALEIRLFQDSRQSRGELTVPVWLCALHRAAFWLGLAFTAICLVVAVRRHHPVALLCAAVLLCLFCNAAVTGILSGPHDRYQNRVIWLALLTPLLFGQTIWAVARESIAVMGAVIGAAMAAAPWTGFPEAALRAATPAGNRREDEPPEALAEAAQARMAASASPLVPLNLAGSSGAAILSAATVPAPLQA